MRDLPNKLIRRDRFRRRQALAILLISATPTLAEPPALVMPQSIPSSPSADRGGTRQVRSNPFCVGAAEGLIDPIQLASGASKSTIRLKPIGKAIGLKSMDDRSSESDSASEVSSNSMTIESVPAQIQNNPLIDSVHRENNPLVETELVEASKAASEIGAKRGSTMVLRPVRPIIPLNEPVTQSPDDAPPSVSRDNARLELTDDPPPADSTADTDIETEALVLNPLTTDDQPPVLFSFSDHEQTLDVGAGTASENTDTRTVDTMADAMAAQEAEIDSTIDLTPAPSNSEIGAVRAQATNDAERSMNQRSGSIVAPALVAPAIVEPQQSRRAAVITAPARPANLDLRAKRYRPPVAVKSVPLAIERSEANEGNLAAVQSVPKFDPQTIALVGAIDIKRVSLHMNLADVRTLTIGGRLHGARVADHAVCKVVQAGANQLKLIGTGEGYTELFVVADGQKSGQAPRRQVFEIHVSDKTDRSGVELAETAKLLNRSIAETFPACQVLVRERAGELMVAGRCDSQNSAKKILRMVRKTCLVPVRDELIVP